MEPRPNRDIEGHVHTPAQTPPPSPATIDDAIRDLPGDKVKRPSLPLHTSPDPIDYDSVYQAIDDVIREKDPLDLPQLTPCENEYSFEVKDLVSFYRHYGYLNERAVQDVFYTWFDTLIPDFFAQEIADAINARLHPQSPT